MVTEDNYKELQFNIKILFDIKKFLKDIKSDVLISESEFFKRLKKEIL